MRTVHLIFLSRRCAHHIKEEGLIAEPDSLSAPSAPLTLITLIKCNDKVITTTIQQTIYQPDEEQSSAEQTRPSPQFRGTHAEHSSTTGTVKVW